MPSELKRIRSIMNRNELKSVYDVLDRVFPNGREFFQERLDHDSTYDPATTWIAMVNDVIASTVQIFPFHSRIEDASIKIGGLGSVATLPEYRGQGLCQEILQAQTDWMEAEEYDLSLLFAVITPFYEKAGWTVVPEPYYELDIARISSNEPASYTIEPCRENGIKDMAIIYETFNHSRTYTVIRPRSFWNDRLHWPKWQASSCLLAKKGTAVAAYGHMSALSEDTVQLEELCYLPGEEQAALDLFYALLSLYPKAIKLHAKLPGDHVLVHTFEKWQAEKQQLSYAMWKIIGFQPLLSKLSSIFARRLQAHSNFDADPISLHMICELQNAYFHYNNGEVSIESVPREGLVYSKINLSQRDWVHLLLQGTDETEISVFPSTLIRILFPKQHFVFYLTDKF